MEAALLALLLTLGVAASDANFYGSSISFAAPKWNKNGTFTVGGTTFLWYYRPIETEAKQTPAPAVPGRLNGPVTLAGERTGSA